MKSGLLLVYLASILFSVIMAFICRKHLASRKLLIMLPFLFLVFVQEVLLGFPIIFDDKSSNAIVYNIYQPVTVIVFGFIYYSLPLMWRVKKLIAALIVLYLLIVTISYVFLTSIFSNNSYLPLVRGFLITLNALLFLSRYFNLDNSKEEKFWRPLLWITIGIATFYPVISISISFQKYLATSPTFYGFRVYQTIPRAMSIFMYSCFSYAFYLCQKKK